MSSEWIQNIVAKSDRGRRLDEALARLFPERSRAAWQKEVRRGNVLLDGRRVVRSNVRLAGGEELRVQGASVEPDLIHEDPHVLVFDKPAGWLTHPADRASGEALSTYALRRFGALAEHEDPGRAGVVHRLDRGTSGLVVFARTPQAMRALRAAFRERSVDKDYLALVRGAPVAEAFDVDLALEPQPGSLDRQRVSRGGAGKAATTRFEVLERFQDATLLRCLPRTGRRHQIRVHLLACGLELFGEQIYMAQGLPRASEDEPNFVGHALHAHRLAFPHPETAGGRLALRAEPPATFERICAWLRATGR